MSIYLSGLLFATPNYDGETEGERFLLEYLSIYTITEILKIISLCSQFSNLNTPLCHNFIWQRRLENQFISCINQPTVATKSYMQNKCYRGPKTQFYPSISGSQYEIEKSRRCHLWGGIIYKTDQTYRNKLKWSRSVCKVNNKILSKRIASRRSGNMRVKENSRGYAFVRGGKCVEVKHGTLDIYCSIWN